MSQPTQPRKRGRPRHEQPSAAYLAQQAEIIDVAIDVFKERGFDQGNLDDVAASLGTGRASLYHYVPSKAHLLYLIFDGAISTTLDTMDRLAAIPDPGERRRRARRRRTSPRRTGVTGYDQLVLQVVQPARDDPDDFADVCVRLVFEQTDRPR